MGTTVERALPSAYAVVVMEIPTLDDEVRLIWHPVIPESNSPAVVSG